ncbi:zinc-dependent alcohol dehydrogenase family protein [bacterium]|nr:zinc-dependent alcohol dehydrogenase family protein [bacterium]
MKHYKAIRAHHVARPFEVPHCDELPLKPLKNGQIRLNVIASPINPADINMLEGMYVTQPEPPFVLGNEGVGEVVECGPDVSESWLGQRVIVPYQHQEMWDGWWQEQRVVSIHQCIQVPESISDEQAAMLSINPITAYELLSSFSALNPGDWIIQNAANSALGRWVIYIAKQRGIKTVNVVRRESLTDELMALGANEVVVDGPDLATRVSQKGNCKLALNGVGGESASQLARCLVPEGYLLTYGAMGRQPVTLSNALLIYKRIHACGFNRTLWAKDLPLSELQSRYNQIFEWLTKTPFTLPIHRQFPLANMNEALRCAQQEQLNGKVLVTIKQSV